MSTKQMEDLLARVRPGLSGHSMKRETLCHLMKYDEISMEMIVKMARYSNQLFDLPAHTRAYLPHVKLALSIGTQQATRLL